MYRSTTTAICQPRSPLQAPGRGRLSDSLDLTARWSAIVSAADAGR
jgi:hypothetical protein